ncbi:MULTISPECIES: hypothetical protein [Clostridium]|uniref:hypothetical protein n=1 Tax=Clostridium TaxID=1485 RepID=UPI001586349D|nr:MULTISPECIES: hypothetical protein [Clostridium]
MSDDVIVTAIVCITAISIVGIFSTLAYLKEKASLKLREDEISITVNDGNKKTQKK